jgi:hypothetical protein
VLERANLEAVLLADGEVTSEHVLLVLAGHGAGGLDPATVRTRVLDLTEGVPLPSPPEPPWPERDPETAIRQLAPGLQLAPTPDGRDPRRRMLWGSRIFLDADGRPLIVPVEVPEGSSVEGPAHGA